jgi:hypothetical protein
MAGAGEARNVLDELPTARTWAPYQMYIYAFKQISEVLKSLKRYRQEHMSTGHLYQENPMAWQEDESCRSHLNISVSSSGFHAHGV